MARLLLVLVALVLAPAAAAQAGTVTFTSEAGCAGDEQDPACYELFEARFVAAPGERNDVTVDLRADRVVVRDAAVAPTAGVGCAAAGPDAVECLVDLASRRRVAVDQQLAIDVELGDEADRADVGALEAPVDNVMLLGGAGDDVLRGADVRPAAVSMAGGHGTWLQGGDGDDELLGGAAPEILIAGAGRDTLRGGGGDDHLDGDGGQPNAASVPVFADVLDGGDGRDTVTYDTRRAPVAVDLADPAPDGEAGEGDALTAIENVRGGNGPNVLRGDDGPNELTGSAVAGVPDTLEGRGGDDLLQGHEGVRDVLDGAAGNDRLAGAAGTRRCGAGTDTLDGFGASVPPRDCERVVLVFLRVDVDAVRLSGRTLVVRVHNELPRPLQGTVAVQARAGDRLVRKRVRLRRGETRRLTFRLPRASTRPRLLFVPGGGLSTESVRLRRR